MLHWADLLLKVSGLQNPGLKTGAAKADCWKKTLAGVLAKIIMTSMCFKIKADPQLSSDRKVSSLYGSAHSKA